MSKETMKTLLQILDKKIVEIMFNETMLEWAKEKYFKELVNARKELMEQIGE